MSYEVIDNFLPKDLHNEIKTVMTNGNTTEHIPFPWYLSRNVAYTDASESTDFYMYHPFYWDFAPASDWLGLLQQLIQQLNAKSLIRIKGNLYPSTKTLVEHEPHIDLEYAHKGAVYYVNTNNGFTVLEDGTKVESIENRVLLFDASRPHHSTTCTDDKFRVTVNVNYF